MRLWVFGVAVLTAALVAPAALGTTRGAARPNTTVPDVFLPIHVTVTDSRISLDRKSGHRGDEVRFTIRNSGRKTHNFPPGTNTKRGFGSQVVFWRTLKPNQEKVYLLFLDYRGSLPYR